MGVLLGGPTPEDGKSAYQSWLDLGNVGTEAQFVASLKGADGVSNIPGPPGPPGPPGTNGTNGTNATIEAWKNIGTAGSSYNAGWSGYAGNELRFRKDSLGQVYMQGMGVCNTANTWACTLPVGYRPIRQVVFSSGKALTSSNLIAVQTDGKVIVSVPQTGGQYWFDEIRFFID